MTADTLAWLVWPLVVVTIGIIAFGLLRRRWSALQARLAEEANTRLRLPVPEFALTDRETVIQALLVDPELVSYMDAAAAQAGEDRGEVEKRARRYAESIGPSFSTYFYFKLGFWLSRTLIRLHYRVRAVTPDEQAFAHITRDTTVILVSNHRSNMDPLVITYLASRRSTVALSAGEWARLWPLHHLVRAAGGFVVDRDAADPLYRQVLGTYLRMAAAAGLHQAFFPEGELTRDGKMGAPKLGFLNYYCRARSDEHDIVFIPVGVNYDRIPEDRRLAAAEHAFATRGKLFLIGSSLRYAASVLLLPLRRGSHRFGHACVGFGTPVSLTAWLNAREIDTREAGTQQRYPWLPALAAELMESCGRQIPAPPVVMLACVMCEQPDRESWRFDELEAAVNELAERLTAVGAYVYMPGGIANAVAFALEILTHFKFVHHDDDDRYAIIAGELAVLRHYANSIAHFLS